ncbi:hypothetical protein ACOMHN_000267 [Nucella lapillus]
MIPRLNYNSMDLRRSSDASAEEPLEQTEHRYINLESFQLPENERTIPEPSTPLITNQSLPRRLLTCFRACVGAGEPYDTFPAPFYPQTLRSVYDIRRNLGAWGGVFAPVALGQLGNNIFLRTEGGCDDAALWYTHVQDVGSGYRGSYFDCDLSGVQEGLGKVVHPSRDAKGSHFVQEFGVPD